MKPLAFVVLLTVAAVAVVGNVPPPPPAPPRPVAPAAPAWEYRTHGGYADPVEFNKLGAEGWELATSYYQHPNGPAIHTFKRPRR